MYFKITVLITMKVCHIFSVRANKIYTLTFLAFHVFTASTLEYVSLLISDQLYFLRLSEVWSMLHGSVGRFQNKECYIMFCIRFRDIFIVFHYEICVFIIFVSFLHEVSNFRNRKLTNQNQQLMIRNCQWNFMLANIFYEQNSIYQFVY